MDRTVAIVAHPTFTRAVLRLSIARRKEVYIALRAIERGDELLERDQGNIYHFDLAWEPGRRLRLLLARGVKGDREVALAVNAFWIDAGGMTSATRITAARRAWETWAP